MKQESTVGWARGEHGHPNDMQLCQCMRVGRLASGASNHPPKADTGEGSSYIEHMSSAWQPVFILSSSPQSQLCRIHHGFAQRTLKARRGDLTKSAHREGSSEQKLGSLIPSSVHVTAAASWTQRVQDPAPGESDQSPAWA